MALIRIVFFNYSNRKYQIRLIDRDQLIWQFDNVWHHSFISLIFDYFNFRHNNCTRKCGYSIFIQWDVAISSFVEKHCEITSWLLQLYPVYVHALRIIAFNGFPFELHELQSGSIIIVLSVWLQRISVADDVVISRCCFIRKQEAWLSNV